MADLAQLFLMSTDLGAARRFYEDAVGLEPDVVGDSSVTYDTGACELKIQADFDPEELEAFGLSPPPARGRGDGAVVVLTVDESIEETYDRVDDADTQGELLIEPREVPWGGRMFLVRDPDGYVLEIRPGDEDPS
jgi:catechol 2,3-dioxygenase-like lactoylglutathione lyase family enzyme